MFNALVTSDGAGRMIPAGVYPNGLHDPGPFSICSSRIVGWSGIWDLHYFNAKQSAYAFWIQVMASGWCVGPVDLRETSTGIWRVAFLPSDDFRCFA